MRTALFEYSQKITSKSILDNLPQKEKDMLTAFKDYMLISASAGRAEENIREVLRLRKVTSTALDKLTLEDLRYYLKELKGASFADYTKNKMKGFIQRFLRWAYKDWSERFNSFDDIIFNTDAQRAKPITSKEVLTKEQLELLMKNEPSLFWKTFLIVQYEGAFRTGEVRKLLWDDVKFEDDGFVTVKVSSKKNKNATSKFRELPLKESAYYLQELKELQRVSKSETAYVFPAPLNPNKPISKAVNGWFHNLTTRVLGHPIHNYLLRHTRGTELKKLVKEGGMSKDNAIEYMGHSEKMFDKVYSHMDKEDIKQLLKKQVYNFKYIAPKEENELKGEISILKQQVAELQKALLSSLKEV